MEKEKTFIEKVKFVTIAILATSVAIMTTFLQINFEEVMNRENLEIAVMLFSVTIPYLLLDVYFLIIEPEDGKHEQKLFSYLRIIFWIIGGIAIGFSFNILNNTTGVNTMIIFWASLVIFFIVRWLGLADREDINK